MEKQFLLVVNFKDGSTLEMQVRDKVPATSGHNLLMWSDVDGSFYMVNELEVQYIASTPLVAK